MLIIESLPLLHQCIHSVRQQNKYIALVPTMGSLHDGHMKLIDEAKSRADIVVVTIFVNPMQFDRTEDLIYYPRTLKQDCKKLSNRFVDFVFIPLSSDIYPQGIESTTYVDVTNISTILEGNSRPKYFRGVLTIVSKLFNLICPDIALFGTKDYQQLSLIRKMVVDMHYNVKIIDIPIIRAKDGLALSSRNIYLTNKQRDIAPILINTINLMAKKIISKNCDLKETIVIAEQSLNEKGFHTEYIQILDADSMSEIKPTSKYAVILVAAWLGRVRLIDNIVVKLT